MATDHKGPGHNRDHNFIMEKKSHWDGSDVHPTLNQSFNTGAIGYSNQELFSQGGCGLVGAIPIHDQATRNAGRRGDKQDGKGNGLGIGKPGDPAPTLTKGDKHAVFSTKLHNTKSNQAGKFYKDYSPSLQGSSPAPAVLYENHPNDSRVTGPHEVAPSCVSRFGTGGGNVPLVQEAIAFQESELRLTGKITEQAVCPTLKANTKAGDTEPKVVAFEPGIAKREGNDSRFVEEMSPTLRKDMGDNQVAVAVDTYNQAVQDQAIPIRSDKSDVCHVGGVIDQRQRMAVRRLTPRECERLQGFFDDHTLIPWRGKPADQCPDGPRYKALGNSMAVPCMRWIGERIARAENERQGAA